MGVNRAFGMFGPCPTDALDRLRQFTYMERDFLGADVGDFTTVGDGTELFAVAATAGGWLSVRADNNTDNEECYGITPTSFSFASGKPVRFAAKVKCTELNTDDANLVVGFSSIGTADFLVDNGGGPAASYDGALFFKVDGNLEWETETSHTTTQQTNITAGTYASATEYELGIFWDGSASVFFSIDGVLAATHTTAGALPTAAMGVVFGIKNGGANQETLLVDWFAVQGCRTSLGSGSIN